MNAATVAAAAAHYYHHCTSFIFFFLLLLLLLPSGIVGLSPDGLTLLAFKSAVSSDPSSALSPWDPNDADPCHWPGVSCANISGFPSPRVVAVSVGGKNLSGYIPSELGSLPYLRRLNLHGNLLSGSIPSELSNATALHSLFLYSNNLSGPIPFSSLCSLPRLQNLDLSSNSLSGTIPGDLGSCKQLQRLLLNGNTLSGEVPLGMWPSLAPNLIQLDLSSNNLSGPIPPDIGSLGSISGVLNLSNNHFSGNIPRELGRLPAFVSVDLRDNDLEGEIPQIEPLTSHGAVFFTGNPGLCGPPLPNPCGDGEGEGGGSGSAAPSSRSGRSKGDAGGGGGENKKKHGMSTGLIVLISVADAAGVALIGVVLVYVYWRVRDSGTGCSCTRRTKLGGGGGGTSASASASAAAASVFCCSLSSSRKGLLCCPNVTSRKGACGGGGAGSSSSSDIDDDEASSSTSSSSVKKTSSSAYNSDPASSGGELVALDKSFAFELDELLRASAYVLGKSGKGGIVYKVVLGSGVPVAVRRVGGDGPPGTYSSAPLGGAKECSAAAATTSRYREFAAEAHAIGRVRHPNVVRLRAYYWAHDEKLLISDYVPNGSLAAALRGRPGDPIHLSWAARLRIAKGVARGLAHIHECSPRKYVHGDIRPSNVLLDTDLTPRISDFGLARLVSLVVGPPTAADHHQATPTPPQLTSMANPVSGHLLHLDRRAHPSTAANAYRAPEARLLPPGCRPAQKWDVYSFGVVLLEMLTGRSPAPAPPPQEQRHGAAAASSPSTSYAAADAGELVRWVRRGFEQDSPLGEMLDPAIVAGVHSNKDALAAFHVALSCTETDPEVRPKMKTVADSLDKI